MSIMGRDEELLELLERLGTGKHEAMRRLAALDNEGRDKLLKNLRVEYRRKQSEMLQRREKAIQQRQAEESRTRHRDEREHVAQLRRREARALSLPDRVGAVLAELSVLIDGPTASDCQAERVSGTAGQGLGPPGAFSGEPSLHDQWTARFTRLCDAAEHELALARGEATVIAAKTSAERDRRILSYEGETSAFVAYMEGVDDSHVRKLRRANDRRPRDGKPDLREAKAA